MAGRLSFCGLRWLAGRQLVLDIKLSSNGMVYCPGPQIRGTSVNTQQHIQQGGAADHSTLVTRLPRTAHSISCNYRRRELVMMILVTQKDIHVLSRCKPGDLISAEYTSR